VTDHQKDQLISSLMYYLPMDIRGKVMREVPDAYNAYCGYTVVEVVRASDGSKPA
jgi:hypothetical protein